MSEQPQPPAPDADVLNDYLYVDRERIGAYHTQLLGSGLPLESKSLQSYNRSEVTTEQVGIPKIFGGGFTSTEGDAHAMERRFDLGWPMVLKAIDELAERGYIYEQAVGVPVGSLVKMRGAMQLVDLRVMRDLWTPMMRLMKQQPSSKKPRDAAMGAGSIAEIAKLIPHPLVVQMVTSTNADDEPFAIGENSMNAWGVLATHNVIGSADTFSLMNGGFVPGLYSMIGILDVGSSPDAPASDPFADFTPSNTFEMMLGMQQMIRTMFGRPNYANGITPLLIYRSLKRQPA